jgi:hypothetical protein
MLQFSELLNVLIEDPLDDNLHREVLPLYDLDMIVLVNQLNELVGDLDSQILLKLLLNLIVSDWDRRVDLE